MSARRAQPAVPECDCGTGSRAARRRGMPTPPRAAATAAAWKVERRPSCGDQDESRGQRAGNRAEGVRGVHARGVAPALAAPPAATAARAETPRRARASSAAAAAPAPSAWRTTTSPNAASGSADLRRDHERHPRWRRYQAAGDRARSRRRPASPASHDGRPRHPPRQPRPDRRAQRQAADERRRHRRERVGRRADDEREQPRPGDFVEQRGEPGDRDGGAREARRGRRRDRTAVNAEAAEHAELSWSCWLTRSVRVRLQAFSAGSASSAFDRAGSRRATTRPPPRRRSARRRPRSCARRPSAGISQKPAAIAPSAAPAVLAA